MRYDLAMREEGYHSAFLTTFSFSANVFEDITLPYLQGAGCRNIVVLSDTRMTNRDFQEIGPPHLAGYSYHHAKREVSGAFHPKISLQLGETTGRLMIGSANLTSAGLVGNLEVVTTFNVTANDIWAAPLFAAALQYFRQHSDPADTAMERALVRALARTPWLKDVPPLTQVRDPEGRLHALLTEAAESSIAETLRDLIGVDVIERLVVVSPFWDANLEAMVRLQEALGNPALSLVVDPQAQDFGPSAFRRLSQASLHAISSHPLRKDRPLHAKLVIACGSRADYVLSGSANATLPGLFSRFGAAGNAEACVLRVETAGTAIPKLQLDPCLKEEMPLDALRLRDRSEGASDALLPVRDGGSASFEQGQLTWLPPKGCQPQSCLLEVRLMGGSVVSLGNLARIENRWLARLDNDGQVPRLILVHFADGTVSAPVPVALLSSLARNAAPPLSNQDRNLLEALGREQDIDADVLEIALNLEAMRAADIKSPSAGRRRAATAETSEEPASRILSTDEFLRRSAAAEAELDQTLHAVVLGDLRRKVNSVLGFVVTDADAMSVFAQGEMTFSQGFEDAPLEETVGGSAPVTSSERVKPRAPRSDREAALIEPRLMAHVNQFSTTLREGTEDPFSLRRAMVLRLLIMAILAEAATPNERPSVKHPLLFNSGVSGGWVRLLGRLLTAHYGQWGSSAMLGGAIDPERVEALATLLFAASLIQQTAQETGMRPPVLGPIASLSASMTRSVEAILSKNPVIRQDLEGSIQRLDLHFSRLRAKRSACPDKAKATKAKK